MGLQDSGTGDHIGIHLMQGPVTGSEEKQVLSELSGPREISTCKGDPASRRLFAPTDCTHSLREQLQM